MNAKWSEVEFGDACSDVSSRVGKLPSQDWQRTGSIPIIDQGESVIAGFTSDEKLAYRGELPAIVFGDHTRRFKFVDRPFVAGADGVKVLAPSPRFEPRFLYWFLSSVAIESAGYSRHFKFLKEVRVPLPPIDEQRRLARILDAAARWAAVVDKKLELVDELIDATYVHLFGLPEGPSDLARDTLANVAEIITGNTPPRSNPSNYGDFLPWIKNEDIGLSGHYVSSSAEHLSETGVTRARTVGPGAVLVTCISGSPRAIGRVGLTARPVAFNQQINAAVPTEMDARFLYAQLRLSRQRIRGLSTGGMKGLISKSALQTLEVVVPPQASQTQFAVLFDSVQVVRTSAARASASFHALRSALVQRAFAGEL